MVGLEQEQCTPPGPGPAGGAGGHLQGRAGGGVGGHLQGRAGAGNGGAGVVTVVIGREPPGHGRLAGGPWPRRPGRPPALSRPIGGEAEQIRTPGQAVCLAADDLAGAAAEAVAHHGRAAPRADCVTDLGKHASGRGLGRDEGGPNGSARPACPGALQLREGSACGDPSDRRRRHLGPQTVSRWRPLSRRDFRIARPARVDMRLRKPWVLARFRVLGW